MAFDDTTLSSSHDLVRLSVLSSTKIESRTSSIIAKLSATSLPPGPNAPPPPTAASGPTPPAAPHALPGQGASPPPKPTLLALTSRAKTASKLISIVEIAKRELAARKIPCYQYNALSSETIEIPRERTKQQTAAAAVGREVAGPAEDDEYADEAAFETMGAPTGPHKRRDVPVLTIWLSREAVMGLRREFG